MIDRKIFFTLMSAVTVSGFIVICTLGQTIHYQKVEAKTSNHAQQLEQVKYVVREYEGNIGVFRGDAEKPFRIVDFEMSLLSEYDRAQIEEGIIMESKEELDTFIEDITS